MYSSGTSSWLSWKCVKGLLTRMVIFWMTFPGELAVRFRMSRIWIVIISGVPLRPLRVSSGHIHGQLDAECVQLGGRQQPDLGSPQQPTSVPSTGQRPAYDGPTYPRGGARGALQPASCWPQKWQGYSQWGRRRWGRLRWGGRRVLPPPLQRQQQRQQ